MPAPWPCPALDRRRWRDLRESSSLIAELGDEILASLIVSGRSRRFQQVRPATAVIGTFSDRADMGCSKKKWGMHLPLGRVELPRVEERTVDVAGKRINTLQQQQPWSRCDPIRLIDPELQSGVTCRDEEQRASAGTSNAAIVLAACRRRRQEIAPIGR